MKKQAYNKLNQEFKFSPNMDYNSDYDEVVTTSESLQDFLNSRKSWNECGTLEQRGNMLKIEDLQISKFERRYDLYVIELDGHCYAVKQ